MINHDKPLVSIRLTLVLTGVSQSPVSQDYAPLIAENGLDPCCGHLAKGSWLGGRSEPPRTPGNPGNRWLDPQNPRFIKLLRAGIYGEIPSGKRTKNYGKSPFLMGKSTISMAIFNSFLYVYQRDMENPKDRSAGLVRWESHLSMGDVPAFATFDYHRV